MAQLYFLFCRGINSEAWQTLCKHKHSYCFVIGFRLLYDELYIDLQHILLVIAERLFGKDVLSFEISLCFYMNTIGTSRMILNVTEVHVFTF